MNMPRAKAAENEREHPEPSQERMKRVGPIPAMPVFEKAPTNEEAVKLGAVEFAAWGVTYGEPDEALSANIGRGAPRTRKIDVKNFSEEFFQDTWGDGTYRVQFYDDQRKPVGKCQFVVGLPSHLPDEEDQDDLEESDEDEPIEFELKRAEIASNNIPASLKPPPVIRMPERIMNDGPPLPMPQMAPPHAGLPAQVPQGDSLMQALTLFQHFQTMAAQQAATAQAQSEIALRRYEVDMKATLERERQAHDKAIIQQQAYFKELQGLKNDRRDDPRELVHDLRDMIDEKLDNFREEIANGPGHAPRREPPPAPKSIIQDVADNLDKVQPIMTMIQGAMGGNGAT